MKRDATVMPCRWGKKRTSSWLEELVAKRMELKERELRLKETGLQVKNSVSNSVRQNYWKIRQRADIPYFFKKKHHFY